MTNLSPEDHADLEEAVRSLEKPGFAPKLIDIIGLPLDKAMAALPHNWKHVVHGATHKALMSALELAMLTMHSPGKKPASNFLHKLFVAASGAGGGALGLVSLPVELPFSTCLILRSVADTARSEGEEIRTMPAKLACLEVLALGGPKTGNESVETGYYAERGRGGFVSASSDSSAGKTSTHSGASTASTTSSSITSMTVTNTSSLMTTASLLAQTIVLTILNLLLIWGC
jgi:hypothetical protein